ncbi:DUF5340 domain-containing protein [Thermocoleostomius sinensis]|uniref:DUF5340 domain-containing protein n=1 Tax=Thermocoleostomius sinensis A174 TaxID=2016057 RepID=A0A9E8ZCW5_9CYAN|nr:DUF5340 domain-containing protein [Thermocoleostomius sinensis]WAL60940.1 DUF5340 domain-containing protein [Thermocoleostomius sinensis A174]
MEPIPLPSHIHYELLLQLLERQTMLAVGRKSPQQEQVHELIVTLRKALTQQKQLEESCQRANVPIDYRWSLNHTASEPSVLNAIASPPAEPVESEPIQPEPVPSSESCHP